MQAFRHSKKTVSHLLIRANILKDQFAFVFTSEPNAPLPTNTLPTFPTIQKITIAVEGFAKLQSSTKPHKATDPDSVPAHILKEAAEELVPVPTLLFQSSLDKGTVPDDWKRVKVVPVCKKGDRSTSLKYRPISLTSICSKLMAHIVHSNIMKHLHSHNILTDNQHGFQRRSCEIQLIITIGDLANTLNNKEQFDVILLDFAKAFEKVPNRRLLQKVEKCGVRGNILKWITSFLQNRTQQMVLEGQSSAPTSVLSGVPQGTVLGLLLFIININDLSSNVKSTARIFADNTIVYRKVQTETDADILQGDLDDLQKWASTWLMEFNVDKCQLLRVTNKRKTIHRNYTLNEKQLLAVDSAKYLGDNDLY